MRFLYILLITSLLIAGCSGGSAPTVPPQKSDTIDQLPVIGLSGSADNFNAIGIMGAYDLSIDRSKSTAELTAKRTTDIGESYIVNGISYFTISPCTNCLKIKSVSLTNEGFIKLTFYIRHPFRPGDPLKPPSGLNRLDLDIFDVALMIHPVTTTAQVYNLTGESAYTGIVTGNSGYSTELTNVIDDNAALPYILAMDDSISGTSTYNKFAMGAEAVFDVIFTVNQNTNFDLYLTFGYGASAKKSQRLNPTYFNPEFNRKSAWKVAVSPPNGSNPPAMGNTWNDGDTTTPFPVTIKVYDWQIGATVNPDLTNPTDIHAASGVSKVSLEIPGMHNALVQTSSAAGGTGTPTDPLVYTLSVANENRLSAGNYIGLVKVSDERVPGVSVIGGETDTMVSSPDGRTREWKNIPEFATYQAFTATVVVGCGPITGQITSPVPCPTDLTNGDTVNFKVTAASSNGGDPIVLYEVDPNYNGTTFNASASNTDGVFDNVGPFNVPDPCESHIPYNFTVAFRATDSCNPPNKTIFTSCDITVTSCCGPVRDVSVISINRGESGAPAARITSVTLDWNDNPCAVEFAIERGRGYEGDNWSVVGVTTTSQYKYVLSGNDWDEDYRFRVIARREVGGNPVTDLGPSEEVFILFMSDAGNTSGNRWVYGYWEDWNFQCSDWQGWADIDVWPANPTYYAYAIGICALPVSLANVWSVERCPHPIPDLDNQKEAFCDGYWYSPYGSNNMGWTSTTAIAMGTLSNPTPPLIATNSDFNPATEIYNGLLAFNAIDNDGLNSEFVKTGVDGWTAIDGSFNGWGHVGVYLNDLLDSSRNYIAIGMANGSQPTTPNNYIVGWCDAWAFVVD